MTINLYSKYLKIITIFILFLISLLCFINIFLIGFDTNNVEVQIAESQTLNNCSVNKWEDLNNKLLSTDNPVYFEAYDLNIFPETQNFYCLGKVIQIENTSESKIFYIGTNRYLFNVFNLIINFSLIVLLLGSIFKDKILGYFSLYLIFLIFIFFVQS